MYDGEGGGFHARARLAFAPAVPREVELLSLGVEDGAEAAVQIVPIAVAEKTVQEGEHLAGAGAGVVLHNRSAILTGTAMGAGQVVEVASRGVDVNGSDVTLGADGTFADKSPFSDYPEDLKPNP